MLHGVHPVLFFNLVDATFLVKGFRSGLSSVELLTLRVHQLERREEDLAAAARALERARFKSKEGYERKYQKQMRTENYKEGDLVLVRNSKEEESLDCKTKPRYIGPYEVVRRHKGGSYVLKELNGSILQQGIAGFRLLLYVSRWDK